MLTGRGFESAVQVGMVRAHLNLYTDSEVVVGSMHSQALCTVAASCKMVMD